MQVSILQGTFFDAVGNIRPSLPINMEPVLGENGFSKGHLRTAPGLTQVATGPGQDRGSIVWQGVHYRVMGNQLCSVIGGAVTNLGNVGNDGNPVRMDTTLAPSLMICSAGGVYYYSPSTGLSQVANPNIGNGNPIDACWIDGYTMMIDGVSMYVTELNSPTTVLPNAYEQPPGDPTPPVAVRRVRDEIYAITTNSIQNFQNVGGLNFPFQVNPSGMIPKGAVGTHAVCNFLNTLAFVGSGINEAPSVYLAGFGVATSISTPEVDRELAALTPGQLAAIEIEGITQHNEQRLCVHLPTVSLVYYSAASQAAGTPIWTKLAAGQGMNQPYPARHFVALGGVFFGGSPTGQIGVIDDANQTQFGVSTICQFDTFFLSNDGRGAILRSAELVGTAGLAPLGQSAPNALMSWTKDGQTWSQQQSVSMGANGAYSQRMQWRPKTRMRNFMGLRFQLQAAAVAAFGTLEVDVEPLNA